MWDPKGPSGAIRRLTGEEVWLCQGRPKETWDALVAEGVSPNQILVEGNKATGGHTAKAMVLMAGYMVAHDEARAGGGDSIEVENITKLFGVAAKMETRPPTPSTRFRTRATRGRR